MFRLNKLQVNIKYTQLFIVAVHISIGTPVPLPFIGKNDQRLHCLPVSFHICRRHFKVFRSLRCHGSRPPSPLHMRVHFGGSVSTECTNGRFVACPWEGRGEDVSVGEYAAMVPYMTCLVSSGT